MRPWNLGAWSRNPPSITRGRGWKAGWLAGASRSSRTRFVPLLSMSRPYHPLSIKKRVRDVFPAPGGPPRKIFSSEIDSPKVPLEPTRDLKVCSDDTGVLQALQVLMLFQ